MSPDGLRFLPIAIVVLVVFTGLPLIVAGAMGLRRSRTGVMQAISVSAIVTGSLLLLGMVLAIYIGGRAFGVVPLFVFLVAVFSFVVWLAALVDCATKEPGEGNDKIVWVIIIVFTQVIGAVLYLLVRRPGGFGKREDRPDRVRRFQQTRVRRRGPPLQTGPERGGLE